MRYAAVAAHPSLTYHAVNAAGEQHTNVPGPDAAKAINAVTWGVWPAREKSVARSSPASRWSGNF